MNSLNSFYIQVGDPDADHAYWGPPEKMTMRRPSFFVGKGNSGGADVMGETAAALAAGSIVFKSSSKCYTVFLL